MGYLDFKKYAVTLDDSTDGSTKIAILPTKANLATFATSSDWTPAAADFKISKKVKNSAWGAEASIGTAPTWVNGRVVIILSGPELTCQELSIRIENAAINSEVVHVKTFGNASAAYPGDYSDVIRMGMQALPNAAAEAAGGLYTRGSGAGQINQDSNGRVDVNLKAILGTVLTETAGLIAAGFKKFFNVATPTGTVNSLPSAPPGTSDGLLIVGNNTGRIVITDGVRIARSATNGNAMEIEGNGDGLGLSVLGGSNGSSVEFVSFQDNPAFVINSPGGPGLLIISAETGILSNVVDVEASVAAIPTAAQVAAAVENQIMDETDGRQVLQAIVNKINSVDADLSGLSITAIAQATRDAILNRVAAGNHDTAGSVGKLLQFLDAVISSRMATFVYTAPDNAGIGTAATAAASAASTASTVNTKVDAIKAKTDLLTLTAIATATAAQISADHGLGNYTGQSGRYLQVGFSNLAERASIAYSDDAKNFYNVQTIAFNPPTGSIRDVDATYYDRASGYFYALYTTGSFAGNTYFGVAKFPATDPTSWEFVGTVDVSSQIGVKPAIAPQAVIHPDTGAITHIVVEDPGAFFACYLIPVTDITTLTFGTPVAITNIGGGPYTASDPFILYPRDPRNVFAPTKYVLFGNRGIWKQADSIAGPYATGGDAGIADTSYEGTHVILLDSGKVRIFVTGNGGYAYTDYDPVAQTWTTLAISVGLNQPPISIAAIDVGQGTVIDRRALGLWPAAPTAREISEEVAADFPANVASMGDAYANDLLPSFEQVGGIDAKIDALADDIAGIADNSGTGAYHCTWTVNDGSTVLQGATIHFTEASNNYYATSDTGGDGDMSLDAHIYDVAITKDGYDFTPTTHEVTASAATHTHTFSMTRRTISPSTDPDRITIFGTTRNGDGSIAPSEVVRFRLQELPDDLAGLYGSEKLEVTSDGTTGVFQKALIRGAIYSVKYRSGTEVTITVPTTGDSWEIDRQVLGRDAVL